MQSNSYMLFFQTSFYIYCHYSFPLFTLIIPVITSIHCSPHVLKRNNNAQLQLRQLHSSRYMNSAKLHSNYPPFSVYRMHLLRRSYRLNEIQLRVTSSNGYSSSHSYFRLLQRIPYPFVCCNTNT